MASGKDHDKAGILISGIVGVTAYHLTSSYALTATVLASYLIGVIWITPDLDINSRQYRRWGPLRIIWWPYKEFAKHRGISHTPIIGTFQRLIYLFLIPVLVFCFYNGGFSGLLELHRLINQHSSYVISAIAGITFADLVHLSMDKII